MTKIGLGSRWVLDRAGLEALFTALKDAGYTLVGPKEKDGAVVYDALESVASLPEGVTDEQAPGRYRLKPRKDKALFGFAVGPHSWKKYLFPPEVRLLSARRTGRKLEFKAELPPTVRYAFIGVRACELAALAVQDKVFQAGPFTDPFYAAARSGAFIVSVQCVEPGGTCFCASMGTGPRAKAGFDLALTERADDQGSDFHLEVGSEAGARMLAGVPLVPATAERTRASEKAVEACAQAMPKSLDAAGIKELLYGNLEHPRWKVVAERCLSCANCTMACPTCFCSTVEETGDLTGDHSERWRRWDSCFTNDFTYIHGGSVRPDTRSKYRQWMTHKLATWHDQFGSSGCVGCGRCLTWCPAGIDITEEARALAEPEKKEDPHGRP